MAIEDILGTLEEQAATEIEAILADARARARAIEDAAREEAARSTAARIARAEEAARGTATAELGHARMRERNAAAADESATVTRAFAMAEERLAAVRTGPAYPSVFAALAAEALDGVEGPCEVRVAPEDVLLAERAVRDAGRGGVPDGRRGADGAAAPPRVSVAPTLATSGGVAVACADGRVLRLNTFESRLDKLRRVAVNDVAQVLRR